jgi:glycosyltransferase involved in cell wall biosynthesis
VYALEASCDVFLSMHRSEGFGLGLAECMYLGKPVVGTDWSGNTEFMRADNSCPVRYELVKLDRDYGPYRKGQTWAEPDPEHAAWYLRKLADDASYRERIAEAGRRTVREELSPRVIGLRYARRLEALARWR